MTVLNALSEIILGSTPFSLMDVPDFPYEQYQEQWETYTTAERWFTGAALDDQPALAAKADLYPMRINPIPATVLKHAYILFGEAADDSRPLVTPKVLYKPEDEDEEQLAKQSEEALNLVWWENHGRALQVENGILSQVYGGCFFKAAYVPWEAWEKGGDRQIPIRIERILPKNVVAIPDPDNYRLLEVWIVKEISKEEAKTYGYVQTDPEYWYLEHWTPTSYNILINGQPAYRNFGGISFLLGGPNPFSFIPIVYIPHIRAGSFLGFNTYDHLTGMIKELNARWGDFGDAVNDDAHPGVAGRNIVGSVQEKKVNSWFSYMDLGSNPGIAGNEHEPDMFEIGSAKASSAMTDMIKGIFNQYRRDAFIPPVADGEDEGSQRSGATLEMRFWPLTAHAGIERYFWTAGLDYFHRLLLRMMATKKLADITDKHAKLRIKEVWGNFLPRDREMQVNEWSVRATNSLASVEHLIELAGDVEDVPRERKRILTWLKDLEEIKAKVQEKSQMNVQAAQAETQMEMQDKNLEAQSENAKLAAKTKAEAPKPKPKPGGAK